MQFPTTFLLLALLLGCALPQASLQAQTGIQGQYHLPGLIGENDAIPSPVLRQMWSVGLVHTFRRSDLRIEWIPGLFYLRTTGENATQSSLAGQGVMAGLDFRMYPMDLYGDCLCPTFNRKGALFEKGFFWEGGAGYFGLRQDLGLEEMHEGHQFYLRLGAGLDIGLNRYMTLSPGLRIQYMHRLHGWGATPDEVWHRPVWFLPFIQLMTYWKN
jgi:hypothetical protein